MAEAEIQFIEINAHFENGPGGARDWVGVFNVSDPDDIGPSGEWVYFANNAKSPRPDNGVTTNNVTLNLMAIDANYEIRLCSVMGEGDGRVYKTLKKVNLIQFPFPTMVLLTPLFPPFIKE